jgi:hypothetical protein
MFPLYNINKIDNTKLQDKFYKEVLDTWAELHFDDPKNGEGVCRHVIWYNSNIKIINNLVFYKDWLNKNIFPVKDILNERGKLKNEEDFRRK